MLVVDDVLQQTQLLLNQRLQLVDNRYVGVKQLQQHDAKLIACARLLTHFNINENVPRWATWLCAADDASVLNNVDTTSFVVPSQAWLVLYQLKIRLHALNCATFLSHDKLLTNPLYWQLANCLQLKLNPLTDECKLSGEALWYLACSAQHHLLPALVNHRQQYVSDNILQAQIAVAAYMLGEKTDESLLCTQLLSVQQLTPDILMLLIVGATDALKTKIINQLASQSSQLHFAIMAMGYSGQLKFVPLLIEFAQQQPESQNQQLALNALDMLLGVMTTDSVLEHQDVMQRILQAPCNNKQIAGSDITDIQLTQLWQSGNQQQRQLVACYRYFADPKQPLQGSTTLLGAA